MSKVNPSPGPSVAYDDAAVPVSRDELKEHIPWYAPGGSMEALYDSKHIQIPMAIALFIALFTVDIRDLALAPNSQDEGVCIVLLLVLIAFTIEMPVCWVCKKGYKWSFFFWMDLIGTVSLIFDICYFFPDTSDANAAVLRASRASKIGARAARLTKLIRLLKVVRIVRVVKLFKFLRPFKQEEEPDEAEVSASKISTSLSEMISKRVAGLVMLAIIIAPLLAYEGVDASLPAHLDHFDATYERRGIVDFDTGTGVLTTGSSDFAATLDSFFKFYDDAYYKPYMLRVGKVESTNDLNGCWKFDDGVLKTTSLAAVCTCLGETVQEATIGGNAYEVCHVPSVQDGVKIWLRKDLQGNQDRESVSRVSWDGDNAQIVYNASPFVQYSAMMNVLLLLFVIILLVGFSMTLNGKVNSMVLQPLDRIFTSIKDAMADVVSAIGKQHKGGSDKSELDILETAVKKLSQLGDHVTVGAQGGASKHLVAVMQDETLDEGTKEWLKSGYTSGHVTTATDREQAASVRTSQKKKPRVTEQMQLRRQQTKMQMKADLHGLGKSHVTKDLIETFDYDVLLYTKEELAHHVHWIFTHTHCTADFDFSAKTSYAFIKKVQEKYQHKNPYHNFYHAGDVIQTLFMFMRANSGETLLSGLDIFAGLVGALAHDLGHPGVNAAYLINNRDDLAMTYNDTSVLENMHIATLYKLLKENPDADPFAKLKDADWKHARKTIVSAVLATDMAHHFEMVHEVDIFFQVNEGKLANSAERVALFRDNPKNSDFLMRLWMHTADISNPVKNFTVCQKWCDAVCREFFEQGEREKREGMPVSAMMDQTATNPAQLQVNFIEFVVGPLYAGLIRVCPEIFELGIQCCYNRKEWGEMWMRSLEADAAQLESEVAALGPQAAAAAAVTETEIDSGGETTEKDVVAGVTGFANSLAERAKAAREKVESERQKNESRRVAFEAKFAFIADREEQMSRSNPTRHLLVPGAKPFNFTGSSGLGYAKKDAEGGILEPYYNPDMPHPWR